MSEFTKDEALALIEAMRLNLDGKVGFKWFVERLAALAGFVGSTANENEQLHAYLDQAGARTDYEAYLAANPSEGDE